MKRVCTFIAAVAAAYALATVPLARAADAAASSAPGSAAVAQPTALPPSNAQSKVLRFAFRIAESSFDPVKVNDIYSRTVIAHLYEPLYRYDHLARPAKIVPLTAASMPDTSDNYRVHTVRLQPGIYFTPDAAFGGKPRELVAADYVYSIKRFADPKNASPLWGPTEALNILGLAELRQQAIDAKKPFDYDKPIEGLKALDRYTLQVRVAEPRPRLLEYLAVDYNVALAREVVDRYADDLSQHVVGTGPFVLAQWRRASLIALDRNPHYRERYYDNEPSPGDAEGAGLAARFKGRRLPMVDRVEISIVEENQPRWLSFLNNQADFLEEVPPEFINVALPNGKLAPNLAKRGMQGYRIIRADAAMTVFNMEHPVIGGYTADKVALRRAIALGIDVQREILLVRRGQAIPADSNMVPHTTGYDAAYKSEMSDYDVPRAKALLDLYGYVDRDGDGWRDLPDGKPLVLQIATQPDQQSRALAELWQRNMDALNIRVDFVVRKWPENLKNVRAGNYMAWGVGSLAASPDGQDSLGRLYSPLTGGQNITRFKLPEFDALYARMSVLPDGPEREALFLQAKRIAAAYMPNKVHVHRYISDIAQPWLIGYRRPLFWLDWWQYVDIDHTRDPGHKP